MGKLISFGLPLVATACAASFALAGPHKHKEDFEVALDLKTGNLTVLFDEMTFPFELPDSKFPLLDGFAIDDPGFLSLPKDEATLEYGPIDADASIVFEVISTSSSAFKVWDPLGPGEAGFEIEGDRRWTIGPRPFDTHPYWHIDTSDPSYDPLAVYEVTFRLIDLRGKGSHGPSEAITVAFTPEPASLALVALLLVAARGVRR